MTAEMIRGKICQLLGFAIQTRRLPEFKSLSGLVNKDLVSDYVSWCINERGVLGGTLHTHLGHLEVAMRQHPSYATLDLTWFKPLLESLPVEPESDRKMRKAKKYLDYEVLEVIPSKIHAQRYSILGTRKQSAAALAMEELLIKWLLALPWRQRNIIECRIGGSRPNIFQKKIPNHIAIDKPAWIRSEEQKNPDAVFWQMHFVAKETKNGREVHAFVPRQLIRSLEEYLAEFRPQLVGNNDPGTLFVTSKGAALNRHNIHHLVTRITSSYAGREVNPHLFRDIVAFAWLKAHPKDYLSLSKILWHANINVTIKTYGSRFDESSGVCAMEAWLEEREAGLK